MQEIFKTEEEWLKAAEFIDCIEQMSRWDNKKLIRLYTNIIRDNDIEIGNVITNEIIKQVENLNRKTKKVKIKNSQKTYIKKYSKRYASSKLAKRDGWECYEL